MTDVSLPAGRFSAGDFRIGQVFSRSWSVFTGNFLTFVMVTGVASLPALLVPQPTPASPDNPFQNLGLTLFGSLLMIVLGTVAQAIVSRRVQVMRGRPIDLAESARIGCGGSSRSSPLPSACRCWPAWRPCCSWSRA